MRLGGNLVQGVNLSVSEVVGRMSKVFSDSGSCMTHSGLVVTPHNPALPICKTVQSRRMKDGG